MAEKDEACPLNIFFFKGGKEMAYMLDKWEDVKTIVGAEYALKELEKALGTWLLTDHVKFILRMNDYDCHTRKDKGGEGK